MLPGFPTMSDLVSGIISAFLGIFTDPGVAAIKASIQILLGISSVNLTGGAVLKLYLEMWGLGVIISMISSGARATSAFVRDDDEELHDSALLTFKSFMFGKVALIFFGGLFIIAHQISGEIASRLPESNMLIDTLSSLNPVNFLMKFAVAIISFVVAITMTIEVGFITVIMPVFLFVISPVAFALSGGSRPNKLYNTFLSLSITAILSGPVMIAWLVFTNWFLVKITTDFAVLLDYREPLCCLMLVICTLWPYFIYRAARRNITIGLHDGRYTIHSQAQAAEAARRQRITENYDAQKTHHVRDAAILGAALYTGGVAAGAIGAMEAGGASEGATALASSVTGALRSTAAHPASGSVKRAGISALLVAGSHITRRKYRGTTEETDDSTQEGGD